MDARTRNRRDEPEDADAYQDCIPIKVTKGAGGARSVLERREDLRGLTNREIVQRALGKLGASDSFAQDAAYALENRHFSLELEVSGAQSHWVDRDAPLDETVLAQQGLHYAFKQDHVGGL